jgi:ABC-2 type transport system permease protein
MFMVVKMSFAQISVYRLSLIFNVLGIAVWLFGQVLFFEAIFMRMDSFGGYSRGDMYLLLGINELFFYFYVSIIMVGRKRNLSNLIRNFDLDNYLLKPVNQMLFVTLDYVALDKVYLFVAVIVNTVIAFNIENYHIRLINILVFVLTCILSLINLYFLSLVFRFLSFWILDSELRFFIDRTWNLMRFPRTFIQNLPIQFLFTYVIPMLLLINVPFKALLGDLDIKWLGVLLGNTIFLYIIASIMWRMGVKGYCEVD